MRRSWLITGATVALGSLLLTAPPANSQLLLGAMLIKRMARQNQEKAPAAPAHLTLSYGKSDQQNLDLYRPGASSSPAPLILFVHGGAWSKGTKENGTGAWKASHYTSLGYAFASINYRLVPSAKVEDEAQDVANALAKLIADADKVGIDRNRIVLMGHSAGAHLVALVGTDEGYLQRAGLGLNALAGVIPIDGAAYNVPKQMAEAGNFMAARYDQAFGVDEARQKALSPFFHAAAPNAARFLFLYVQRPDGMAQAKELAQALTAAGSAVQQHEFAGTGLAGHMKINRSLGDPDYAATPVVDAWLKQVFER